MDELAHTTQLFLDTYIALEMLHCSYGEYIQRVPRLERLHLQFYVMLKNAKEEHAQEAMERQAEMDREAQQVAGSGMSGRY
jgi:hypothetical protein